MPARRIEVDGDAYAAEVEVAASADAVFDALTTLDGLAGWWTPTVQGAPGRGGVVTLRFGDERVVMEVERAERPRAVSWKCATHTRLPEWAGTRLSFDLEPPEPEREDATRVVFRHAGLVPALECYGHCSHGWDHYLGSLAAYAAGDGGSPWHSPTWRPAPAH